MLAQYFKAIFFCTLSALFCLPIYGQTLVSIDNGTIAKSPSYTLTNGSSYTLFGTVKNIGTTSITDVVHVNIAIDTSKSFTPTYIWRSTHSYPVTAFAVGSTFSFSVADVASTANYYKGGGGGTTIVVWTRVGAPTNTVTTADSVRSKIYLIDVPDAVNELSNFENSPIAFKNPANETIQLNYDESVFPYLELTNSFGQLIIASIEHKIVNISQLTQGVYYLRFYNKNKQRVITKKVIIEK